MKAGIAFIVSMALAGACFAEDKPIPDPDMAARVAAAQAKLKARTAAATQAATQPATLTIAEVAELRGEVASLRAENTRLKAELARLHDGGAVTKTKPIDRQKKNGGPVPMPKIGDSEQDIVAWVRAPRRLINDGAISTAPMFPATTSETTDGKTINVAVDTGGGNLRDILIYTVQDGKIVRISRLLPN